MCQKSYGKTTRFKIFQVKKVVFLVSLLLGQTRAQRQLLQLGQTRAQRQTTRLNKKKTVPFPPRPNKSSVATTSKVDISRLKVCAHHFFPIFVSFCTITFFDHHFFQFFEVLFFTPTYFFQFFLFFLTPVLDSFRRVIYD